MYISQFLRWELGVFSRHFGCVFPLASLLYVSSMLWLELNDKELGRRKRIGKGFLPLVF